MSQPQLYSRNGLQSRNPWVCARGWMQNVGQTGSLHTGRLWDPNQAGSRMITMHEQPSWWNQGTAAPNPPAQCCLVPSQAAFSLSPMPLCALPGAPPTLSCPDLTAGSAHTKKKKTKNTNPKWTTPDTCCCQEGKFGMLKCCCSPCAWHWFSSACSWPLMTANISDITLYMSCNKHTSCWEVQGMAESNHAWMKHFWVGLGGKALFVHDIERQNIRYFWQGMNWLIQLNNITNQLLLVVSIRKGNTLHK